MTEATLQTTYQVKIGDYLKDLQKLVTRTEDDLRQRSQELSDVHQRLTHEYDQAKATERTLETFESWRDEYLTQVAVAWVLTSVFLRYLEDNGLADGQLSPVDGGAGENVRLKQARDKRQLYFQQNPTHTDREYLQEAFRTVAQLPGCGALFGDERNPLWLLGPSGDMAKEMINFWQAIDPATGKLLRVFGNPNAENIADTRFLGDLYQDLSEAARKRFALLQTPDFVEEFILDQTLEPAIETFGLNEVRMLDPTCGSGHFLLGGFARLLEHRHRSHPGENERVRVQKALDGVYGVDLNPFAVAIARFRLLVAALNASGIRRMNDAPNYVIHVAAGDSLLHGRRFGRGDQGLLGVDKDWIPDAFAMGDFEEATRILSQQYHAVVGNPPYITDKDNAHKAVLKKLYTSCFRKFSLALPCKERFFDLTRSSGYVGVITSNSFMKREFGKVFIEQVFPQFDMTHVIDTSGAYIPGHGTPTVILFGRNRLPTLPVIRAALGIRGEPSTPDEACDGKVWRSIVDNIDRSEAENDFITITDMDREKFHAHPWALSGGGAAELKELIENASSKKLSEIAKDIGVFGMTNADDVMISDQGSLIRRGVELEKTRPLVTGDIVRDWQFGAMNHVLYPYDLEGEIEDISEFTGAFRWLWPCKTLIGNRATFAKKTYFEEGRPWWGWHLACTDRLKTPLTITFAFISSHNHFVLDHGGKVFNRSAPVIKLSADATVDDHLALLGLLNSSVACFYFKKTGFITNMGGARLSEPFEDCYQFAGTQVGRLPVCHRTEQFIEIAKTIDNLSQQASTYRPEFLTEEYLLDPSKLNESKMQYQSLLAQRIAWQEELDWLAYQAYGLLDESPLTGVAGPPAVLLGQRAFEMHLARKVERGDVDTDWFRRQKAQPTTEIPTSWPSDYQETIRKRLDIIAQNRFIRFLEVPEFKRWWQPGDWDKELLAAQAVWLLNHIESQLSTQPNITTTARLAEQLAKDEDFLKVAKLYTGRDDFDLTKLVTDLAMKQDVPYLAALRYKTTGLRKRAQWEKTWDLQRKEDAGEKTGKIPVPPKYGSGDFLKSHYWTLRGKLDVPKERFISYPLAERTTDPSPVIGWAGWNHLDQAKALATYYLERKEQDGWTTEQLTPLLAGLQELIPWLKQWHNDIDPDLDQRLGDFYEGFLDTESRSLNLTPQDLTNWRPPAKAKKKTKKK
jgi:Domain of unknown function (DUF7008)/Eco57I restriction-modification methylase